MNDGLTLPLAVVSTDGSLLGALLMNRKAFHKSIERKEVWVVHPETGRVLPLDGVGFHNLLDKAGSWYQAILDQAQTEAFRRHPATKDASLMAHLGVHKEAVQGTQEPTLKRVSAVIAQRRRDMPEGSYTTHLFQKGEDKIRKKTGEEAIELVLAQNRDDIVSEAADLIYHLMVLLEVKDIPVDEVLAELASRMK
ncbi:MAG: phosphoribosyl-ATP diphosphatase [Spirochaetales bacterium]|nr:phosphoribosyl-ATP diphosphatase [Spirochaetales bacterium]